MEPRIGGNGRGALSESVLHRSNMTSLPTLHKQGHLGDLHEKSKVDLVELLERQEKILKNRKFIDRLPDKGEKIRNFVKTLQDLIAEKEAKENNRMNIDDENKMADVTKKENEEKKLEEDMKHEEELKIIERGFGQLNVHEGPHYQVVVKAGERSHRKSRFAFNRLHDNEGKELTQTTNMEDPSHSKHTTELTSASIHDPDHGPATLISVEECRNLYSTQQKKLQESRAEQLADRMMRRLNVRGTADHPEGKYKSKDDRKEEEENVFEPDSEFLDSVD